MLPPRRYLEFHERSRLICSLFYPKYLKLLDTREKRPVIRVALFFVFWMCRILAEPCGSIPSRTKNEKSQVSYLALFCSAAQSLNGPNQNPTDT